MLAGAFVFRCRQIHTPPHRRVIRPVYTEFPVVSTPRPSSPSSAPSPSPARRSLSTGVQGLERLRRLAVRARRLLGRPAERNARSADQIAQTLFPSSRAARPRLAPLHRLEAVNRFVDVTTGGRPYLYPLGPLGAVGAPDGVQRS
ncbi:hypothetical protein EF879_07375 [Micromonospora sp. HM5-17]|nr:hypothetical protein EF879_07375 [Micromonospora sp. HM5-17]